MNWLRQALSRRQIDRDVEDEIQQHLEEKAEALASEGISPAAARIAARREFGNVGLTAERSREVWRWALVEEIVADLRYAARQFRRAPAFVAASVLTLALGIGANTAVFSVVNAVVLRPLPFPDSGRLMSVQSLDAREPSQPANLSYPMFFEYRKQAEVFDHLVSYHDVSMALSGAGQAVNVPAEIVSWDMLDALRVRPALGRGFLPDEETAGQHAVILGNRLWRERFGANPTVVGRTVTLNQEPYLVVGVAPPGFAFPVENPDVQLWTTLALDRGPGTVTPMTDQAGAKMLNAVGRLKAGVTLARAKAQMGAVGAALARKDPDDYRNVATPWITPELDSIVGNTRRPILILLAAVGLVLLVACANVANLLLSRTAERQREFAVRASIGAGRARIVRQLLTESLALALAGSAAGVLLAAVCVGAVARIAGSSIPRIEQAGVDARVLAFSIGLAFLTTLLFSLAPAARLARMELISPLKEASRGNAMGGDRFRNALVVVQIALGLVLVSGAGLLASGFVNLMHRDVGFRPDGLVTFEIGLPAPLTRDGAQIPFESRVLDRFRALPGVTDAAVGMPMPLAGAEIIISFNIEERPKPEGSRPRSNVAIVTPTYFRTLGIPLLEGRPFNENDDGKSSPVLVVNRAFADKFFPGERVVGKRIEPGAVATGVRNGMREIVGVVGNARLEPLGGAPEPLYYYAEKQLPWCCLGYVARTSGSPVALEAAIRSVVASIEPTAPVYSVRTMQDTLARATASPHLQVVLLGTFAAIALLLTAIGLYGVLAYSVVSRTREIGIRVALGANRSAVLGSVLREAAILVFLGAAIGLAAAAAGNRVAETLLYVKAMPQMVLLTVACVVISLAALTAALVPARRAASVDPVQALRGE